MSKKVFNEQTLRDEIKRVWGGYGAHVDVYDSLIKKNSQFNTELGNAVKIIAAKNKQIEGLEKTNTFLTATLSRIRSLVTLDEWPSLGHLAAAVLEEIEGDKNETT